MDPILVAVAVGTFFVSVFTALIPAVYAHATASQKIRGLRYDHEKLEARYESRTRGSQETRDRLTRMESRLDMLDGRLDAICSQLEKMNGN